MRGETARSEGLFSYVSLEERMPATHSLRPIRRMTDEALSKLSPQFDEMYPRVGSIPRSSNCTTIGLGGLAAAEQETGIQFENSGKFADEYSPLELFGELDGLFGPGSSTSMLFFNNLPKQ